MNTGDDAIIFNISPGIGRADVTSRDSFPGFDVVGVATGITGGLGRFMTLK
jgi:hypothetical protein